MESNLEIKNLTAGYDGLPVVRGIDISVAGGEIVALLGPNGAGKTTILRSVSGIVRPMIGSISVLGADIAREAPSTIAGRGVAHVAEGRSVFFGLTVQEHFQLGSRRSALDSESAYRYFPALNELRDRRVGLLSGGEQQMLALAFALARRPRLLLVDELSLGLAPVIVERLLPVVCEYAKDSGAGVLLVEQHVEMALDIAHRAIGLSHGDVVFDRPAVEVRGNQELLVGSYMGETR
jgi:ABC-type branched-subunit amino acid transport system ATPase component